MTSVFPAKLVTRNIWQQRFADGGRCRARAVATICGRLQDMIRHTATREAPWFVVPADHKWFAAW